MDAESADAQERTIMRKWVRRRVGKAFNQLGDRLLGQKQTTETSTVPSLPAFEAELQRHLRNMQAADLCERSPVSDVLIGRLTSQQIQEIESAANAEELSVLRQAKVKDQNWVRLAIAVHHNLRNVLTATDLSTASPPPNVHSMSRSWLGAGGSYGHADMIVDALGACGISDLEGLRVLDFGCSSGRILRVLRARFGTATLHGCDPNGDAVAWASQTLPGINFFRSTSEPPLALANGSMDVVYAISIWSHFGKLAAARWFAEMHRVLKPGGMLLFTTHGWHSLKYYESTGERSLAQLAEISSSLIRGEHWYAPEFGEAGDHGVIDSQWGTGFFDLRWLAAQVCKQWRVAAFYPGRECGNQDVYVLQRLASDIDG